MTAENPAMETAGAVSEPARARLALVYLGVVAPFLINGYVNATLVHAPGLYWGAELAVWIAIPALGLRHARRHAGIELHRLGFRRQMRGWAPRLSVLAATCLVFAVLDLALCVGGYAVFSTVLPAGAIFRYQSVVPASGLARVAVAAYLALTAGFVEEVLYRGLALEVAGLFRRPLAAYLLLGPIVFALVHWESGPVNVATAWVFGLFASASYVWLRNIWPLVVGHVVTDFLVYLY